MDRNVPDTLILIQVACSVYLTMFRLLRVHEAVADDGLVGLNGDDIITICLFISMVTIQYGSYHYDKNDTCILNDISETARF